MSERLIVSGNPNRPIDYLWLQETLEFIVRNDAAELGCTDLAINKAYYPIFLVAGGCPNMFCGMQAVVYCASSNGNVDFWWVKPDKTNPLGNTIERQTLNRHGKGHHKNDPGRSKPFYKPLADLFSGEEKCPVTGLRYKVEKVSGDNLQEADNAGLHREGRRRQGRASLHFSGLARGLDLQPLRENEVHQRENHVPERSRGCGVLCTSVLHR